LQVKFTIADSTIRDGCENCKKVLGFAALHLYGQRNKAYGA
jgi:hypothetical protein